MERKTILAVDIGGTKYSVGLVSENGVIISKQKCTWWHISEESIIAEICTAMQNILDENPRIVVTAVGITITGLTDPVTGSWVSATYMGVYGLPIGKRIREKFGFPVYVENECNASAVAEKMFGLCGKTEHFMYLSVGNGIGGALFLDGKLYRGAFGAAGEVGSCRMDEIVLKKRSTRKRDTLENLASARGITDIYIKLGGKKKIDGEVPDALTISKMAKEGDLLACETFNIEGRYLGQVIASSCMLLNPEKVIIGGGVAMSFNLFKQSLLETVAQEAHIFAMGTPAKIQVTALGYDAGLLGAAAVALQAEGDT